MLTSYPSMETLCNALCGLPREVFHRFQYQFEMSSDEADAQDSVATKEHGLPQNVDILVCGIRSIPLEADKSRELGKHWVVQGFVEKWEVGHRPRVLIRLNVYGMSTITFNPDPKDL